MIKLTKIYSTFSLAFFLVACGGGQPGFDGSNPLDSDTVEDGSQLDSGSGNVDPGNESDSNNEKSTSALISWDIPTERENGEDLTLSDIGGYEILYRKAEDSLFTSVKLIDQNQSQQLIENLEPGRYTFFIAAFDAEGVYSDFSEPAFADIGS